MFTGMGGWKLDTSTCNSLTLKDWLEKCRVIRDILLAWVFVLFCFVFVCLFVCFLFCFPSMFTMGFMIITYNGTYQCLQGSASRLVDRTMIMGMLIIFPGGYLTQRIKMENMSHFTHPRTSKKRIRSVHTRRWFGCQRLSRNFHESIGTDETRTRNLLYWLNFLDCYMYVYTISVIDDLLISHNASGMGPIYGYF